ncbi:hypothetical protein OJ996_26325, partial [Luteolibacter sp. GHJ8]
EDPTGLLNEGHRYRDLEAGVFISRDPAGFVDGPNVYAYVRQNPWSAFDPEGLAPQIVNTLASMGDDWFGYWGGVGGAAGNMAKGLGQLAMNLDPATNAWQSFAGKKTGYQKIAEGSQQAYHDFVQSAENLGAKAQMNGRTMTESVLDAAANHVDEATKDPKKAGNLAFGTVTSLASGADAALRIALRTGNAALTTARGTQGAATVEAAAANKPDYTRIADPKNLNASTKPTPRQVQEMKKMNMEANNGVLRDDVTGEVMVPSAKSQKGVTPPPNEVQVDHIVPVDKGGTRTMSNLELRTRANNRAKSNN